VPNFNAKSSMWINVRSACNTSFALRTQMKNAAANVLRKTWLIYKYTIGWYPATDASTRPRFALTSESSFEPFTGTFCYVTFRWRYKCYKCYNNCKLLRRQLIWSMLFIQMSSKSIRLAAKYTACAAGRLLFQHKHYNVAYTRCQMLKYPSFSMFFPSLVCIYLGYFKTDISGIGQALFFHLILISQSFTSFHSCQFLFYLTCVYE